MFGYNFVAILLVVIGFLNFVVVSVVMVFLSVLVVVNAFCLCCFYC